MNLYIEDTNEIEMRANQEDEIRLQAGDTINIGGGGGSASAFIAEYGATPYADVKDAYDKDAIIICTVDDSGNTVICQLAYFDDANDTFCFAQPVSEGAYWVSISSDDTWNDGYFLFASTDTATQLRDGLMSALDKQKLDTIESGAEVNVQSDWNATSGDAQILNKPSIPTKTSDLLNDSGFITASDIPPIVPEVFEAEYGVTSYQDILTALEEGKAVVCKYEMEMGGQTVMTAYFSNIVDYIAYQQIVFAAVLNDQTLTLTVDSSDTWADMWGTNVTDVKVNGSSILSQGVASLSNVAVSGSYNDLGDKPEQTTEVTVSTSGDVTYSLEANKIYHFTGQISSLTLTLVATSLIPHYHFDFVSGTTPATISFGSSINWLGGEGLTPQSNMHYEVDILNGRGIFAKFPAAR